MSPPTALYSPPSLYRAFIRPATRLRVRTPLLRYECTDSRTPLKPAAQSQRDLLAQSQSPVSSPNHV